jgi:hypothetical protein
MGRVAWLHKNKKVNPQAAEPLHGRDELDSEDAELHLCCICGAMLGFDLEDEINGEGWGKDICGDCNRTRNDDAITMGW